MGVICKYKFDSSIYADLIPEFNSGYSGYTITDEVEGNIITRTIESDELPTLMRFGSNLGIYVKGSEVALLEILDMNTSGLTSCYQMFRCCTNLTNITCEWNTSNITDMSAMFADCHKLTSLDVSNFDTSNVTTMSFMICNCNNLTSLDLSNFNTSKVTNMSGMFDGCANLTTLDLSNFDTSKVTNMMNMFYNCNNLTSIDVSNFNTSKVTNMNFMFQYCNNLTSLDVSNWDINKVTNTTYMFWDCFNLTSLDVSNWVTSNVTNTNHMFVRCKSLTLLDVSNWDTSKVTNMDSMFWECSSLTSLDVSNFDTSNVTNMNNMFYNCYNLISLDISNFNTSNVTKMDYMFYNTNSLEVITMFNNDINTINTIGNLTSTTIYVDESLDQSQYTGTAPLKVYKEEKIEIKLNSPLLEGDTIEVIDGKLCHVHRMGKVVLDGSEDEGWKKDGLTTNYTDNSFIMTTNQSDMLSGTNAFYDIFDMGVTDNLPTKRMNSEIYSNTKLNMNCYSSGWQQHFICLKNISSLEVAKQWLSENPITVVYKLSEPYYEDITPLQSSIILKTFLESSMTIDTILPIETKLSYRTNVPSISTLSTRATELAESDNVIHNLMNIIDDEVDE